MLDHMDDTTNPDVCDGCGEAIEEATGEGYHEGCTGQNLLRLAWWLDGDDRPDPTGTQLETLSLEQITEYRAIMDDLGRAAKRLEALAHARCPQADEYE